ncbi:MAG: hypothetical protein IJU11_02075, partial [Prevotella sp.]|nr:hypothetical protein [Prevotella sp.]
GAKIRKNPQTAPKVFLTFFLTPEWQSDEMTVQAGAERYQTVTGDRQETDSGLRSAFILAWHEMRGDAWAVQA